MLPQKKYPLIITVLIATLLVSAFVCLYQIEGDVKATAQTPSFIDVTISGPAKLGVNEEGLYTATVTSSNSGKLSYTWSVTPEDGKIVLVSSGETCTLTFVEATEDPYSLSVQVKDLTFGNLGSAYFTVRDPYTSPNIYLGAYGAPYSYLIETDGNGWYRAINGSTGAVCWSSTNAPDVINPISQSGNAHIQLTTGIFSNTTSENVIYMGNFTTLTGASENLTRLNGLEIKPLGTQAQSVKLSNFAMTGGYDQINFTFASQITGYLYPEQLTLDSLYLNNAGNDAIHLKNVNFLMTSVTTNNAANYAAYLYSCFDSQAIGCKFHNSNDQAVSIYNCNQFHFLACVFGGVDANVPQLNIHTSTGVQIDSPWLYSSYMQGISLDASSQILASNIHILDASNGITNHTGYGINIAGDNSIINGVFMETWNLNKTPLIAVRLAAGANNNIICNVQPAKVPLSDVIGIVSVEADNHGSTCYNGTAYVATW